MPTSTFANGRRRHSDSRERPGGRGGNVPWLTRLAIRVLYRRLRRQAPFDIGFPAAKDLDLTLLAPMWDVTLNNCGYPFAPPTTGFSGHTLDVEAEVVTRIGHPFGCPTDDITGHVTSGSTEAIRAALVQARRRLGNPVVYASTAAHYAIRKLTDELCLDLHLVPATARGEMDYAALTVAARQHPGRTAVGFATIGATLTESHDLVPAIHAAFNNAGIPPHQRWIHADAALAGIPLATLPADIRPAFGFPAGSASINTSGHKYLGVPHPCGILVLRRSECAPLDPTPTYAGGPDLTPEGSRNGFIPLMILLALEQFGDDGLRDRAVACRANAARLVELLTAGGAPAWRHDLAFTVVLPAPSASLRRRWRLTAVDGWCRVVCMPGRPWRILQQFAKEYLADLRRQPVPPAPPPQTRRTSAEPARPAGQVAQGVQLTTAVPR